MTAGGLIPHGANGSTGGSNGGASGGAAGGTAGATGAAGGAAGTPSQRRVIDFSNIRSNVSILIARLNRPDENVQTRLEVMNLLSKICRAAESEIESLIPLDPILPCLQRCLVDAYKEIRANALRVLRYMATTHRAAAQMMATARLDLFVVRALTRDHRSDIECEQALKLVRALVELEPPSGETDAIATFVKPRDGVVLVPQSVLRVLVAVAEQPEDKFRHVCIETLAEYAVKNPAALCMVGGLKVVFAYLHESSVDMAQLLTRMVIFLLDGQATRAYIRPSVEIELVLSHFAEAVAKNAAERLNVSTKILIKLMHHWSGLLSLCHSQYRALQGMTEALVSPNDECKVIVLRMFYRIFCFRIPEACLDQMVTHWSTPNKPALLHAYQQLPRATYGEILSPSQAYVAFLLSLFLNQGLVPALVQLIQSPTPRIGAMAITLLALLGTFANEVLPSHASQLAASKELFTMASDFANEPGRHLASSALQHLYHIQAHLQQRDPDRVALPSGPAQAYPSAGTVSFEASSDMLHLGYVTSPLAEPATASMASMPVLLANGAPHAGPAAAAAGGAGASAAAAAHATASGAAPTNAPATANPSGLIAGSMGAAGGAMPVGSMANTSVVGGRPSLGGRDGGVNYASSMHGGGGGGGGGAAVPRAVDPLSPFSPNTTSPSLLHVPSHGFAAEQPDADGVLIAASRVDAIKMKLAVAMDDGQFRQMIMDTEVLGGKDFTRWRWDLIMELCQGPLHHPRRLEESIKQTKFVRRVLSFFRPSTRQFADLKRSKSAEQYVAVGCELLKTLVMHQEGLRELNENRFLPEIAEALGQLDPIYAGGPHDVLFTRERVEKTMTADYFTFLGVLSQSREGQRLLERYRIYNVCYHVTDLKSRDDLVRAMLAAFDYAMAESHPRILIGKVIVSSSKPVRLYATALLRTLAIRACLGHQTPAAVAETAAAVQRPEPFRWPQYPVVQWILPLLVTQLYDPAASVRDRAVAVLQELCTDQRYLELVVALAPNLDHLGRSGGPLRLRFLSCAHGLEYLQQRGDYITREMNYWFDYGNLRYVYQLEAGIDLDDDERIHPAGLSAAAAAGAAAAAAAGAAGGSTASTTSVALATPHVSVTGLNLTHAGASAAAAAAAAAAHNPLLALFQTHGDAGIPPHFYGEIAKTPEGCAILAAHGSVGVFSAFIKRCVHSAAPLDPERAQRLKAVLWAVGHIGAAETGARLLLEDDLVADLVALAETSGMCSVRGTAFYVLGLCSRAPSIAAALAALGWECHHGRVLPPVDKVTSGLPWPFLGSWPDQPYDLTTTGVPPIPPALATAGAPGLGARAAHVGVAMPVSVKWNAVEIEVLKCIGNLSNHILANAASKTLSKLRHESPALFQKLPLYLEAMRILSLYTFRFTVRRFVQELFEKLWQQEDILMQLAGLGAPTPLPRELHPADPNHVEPLVPALSDDAMEKADEDTLARHLRDHRAAAAAHPAAGASAAAAVPVGATATASTLDIAATAASAITAAGAAAAGAHGKTPRGLPRALVASTAAASAAAQRARDAILGGPTVQNPNAPHAPMPGAGPASEREYVPTSQQPTTAAAAAAPATGSTTPVPATGAQKRVVMMPRAVVRGFS